jgi:FkbM family methyltransferase
VIKKIKLRCETINKKCREYLLQRIGLVNITGHWIYPNTFSDSPIIFDLGSNYGHFSREMQIQYGAINFMFEANPDVYEKASKDFGLIFNLAASSVTGSREFYISNNHEASSFNIENIDNWGLETKKIVSTASWTEILRLTQKKDKEIDLIKIDIEGSEIEFLENFTQEQLNWIKALTVEFHDWLDVSLREKTADVIKKMKKNGFLCLTNAPNHNWPVEMCFLNKKYYEDLINHNFYFKLYNKIYDN